MNEATMTLAINENKKIMSYEQFLQNKLSLVKPSGFDVDELPEFLFDYQKFAVKLSLNRGKFAIFAGTGLGKTSMQLAWALEVFRYSNRPVLIVAPLAVAKQTANDEATKFGIVVKYCQSQDDVINGINVTNYERLQNFDCDTFAGVCLDESSILKGFNGKTRTQLIEAFKYTPYKLCCTATPSPNDYLELGNHCEFLNVMSRDEMLATFFVHDGKVSLTKEIWKLKNHGKVKFWEWLSSWSIMFQKPSHLGFSDDNYKLPKLIQHEIKIESGIVREGELFTMEATGLVEQRHAKRSTIENRVKLAAELINASDDQWLVWCDLNDESALLKELINESVEVKGSDKDTHKEQSALDFAHGKIKVLISKPKIYGFGMNFQNCHNVLFVGLSNSFELTYQAIRRCYRFGQQYDVNVYHVCVDIEGAVLKNIKAKHKKFEEMQSKIAEHFMSSYKAMHRKTDYNPEKIMTTNTIEKVNGLCLNQAHGQNFDLFNADCVEGVKAIPDNSIGYSIFSPPFADLFVYSDSINDMGNVTSDNQFYEHFKFLLSELYRVMMPGRLVSVHCQDLISTKGRDGEIGIKDFSGKLVQLMEDHGFVYHSRVTIWKDPVCQMQRLKPIGLLHKQVKKDSSLSRQGLPDYLLTFRKKGDNLEPIEGRLVEYYGEEEFSRDPDPDWSSIAVWQRYASPVWMDIAQNDTLNFREAKEDDDHKHICLAKGSLVLTYERGYVPIETLQIGEKVLTHKGRWMPIVAHAKTSDSADAVAIRATGVHDLTVTPTHKLWTRFTGDVNRNFKAKAKSVEPDWVEAKDLVGSFVNQKLPPEEDSDLTETEWWAIGRWIADGHIDQRNIAYISCGSHKIEYFLEKLGHMVGNPQVKVSCSQFPLKDKDYRIRNVLHQCGQGAVNKQLPPVAFRLPVHLAKALLDGYLAGDGYLNQERQRWMVSSISKQLLLGLQFLIQRVYGVTATLHDGRPPRKEIIEGREVNCHQEWNLSFQAHGYQFSFVDDQGAWKKVKSVESVGQVETWNIEVAEDHSYTAEGCIVKNCPLQLTVIRRALQLWSNPNDVVLSPFAGIGSEGYVSLDMGRKFIGFELKKSYYDCAVKNLEHIENKPKQFSLFDAA